MSLTHPVEARPCGLPRDAGLDLASALRAIALAPNIALWRVAVASAVQLLDRESAFAVMAAEVAPSLGAPSVLWQSGFVADDDTNLERWFAYACQNPSRLLQFGLAGIGIAVPAGHDGMSAWLVLLADGSQSAFLRKAMDDVAHLAAQQLFRLRQDSESLGRAQRMGTGATMDAALIRATADIVWESHGDGPLHVTQVFHGRADLARALEGRRLEEIAPGGRQVLATGRSLRSQRVELPGVGDGLMLVAAQFEDGRVRGTLLAVARGDGPSVEAVVLETIMDARRRAEQLRAETEVMMMGLRLLLGEHSFREKLEQLARHLAQAIGGDELRLVLARAGEPPRLILPDVALRDGVRRLENILAQVSAPTAFAATTSEAAFLAQVLGMGEGEIVLVALPAQAERYTLLCRTREPLSPHALGVAERISLLLQHALVMQADQQRIIQAGKLSALGQMATSIAHELRQPLNAISMAAQNIDLMLEMDSITPEILQEKSARILAQVDRACQVMDRMRRFGRKSAGTRPPVSLAAIARSARSLMDKVSEEAGIAIEIAVADGIDVMADELEIEQVLVNLIQNASDAIQEKGAGPGLIRLFTQDDADPAMVQLCVEDNGPGIPADVQKHALDAFFTTKPAGKGTGLGLSIAHSILREHGGRLLVGNGAVGARVTLLLRRAPQARALRRVR